MAMWNAWRGCKKCSDGCLHCYIHKGDFYSSFKIYVYEFYIIEKMWYDNKRNKR